MASTERTLEFARVEARDISMNIQNKAYHAIDNVMLHICKLQEVNGRRSGLQDPARKQEIWELQEKPEPPLDSREGKDYTYRYQTTLKFLDNNGTDN
ncbi:hypothetical protein DPV78_002148 [Talaromyces pinophilus]|nr:hypothetical protein DPV78_002148 [Talaromyces pinophilus]